MDSKRPVCSVNIFTLLGVSFAVLGAVFVAVGAVFGSCVDMEDRMVFILVFCLVGGFFLLFGIGFLLGALAVKGTQRRLLASGRYIWGQIAGVSQDFSVQTGTRSPVFFTARYQDGKGNVHLFRSKSYHALPDQTLIGKPVRIYYEGENFRRYVVDMDELLREYIVH